MRKLTFTCYMTLCLPSRSSGQPNNQLRGAARLHSGLAVAGYHQPLRSSVRRFPGSLAREGDRPPYPPQYPPHHMDRRHMAQHPVNGNLQGLAYQQRQQQYGGPLPDYTERRNERRHPLYFPTANYKRRVRPWEPSAHQRTSYRPSGISRGSRSSRNSVKSWESLMDQARRVHHHDGSTSREGSIHSTDGSSHLLSLLRNPSLSIPGLLNSPRHSGIRPLTHSQHLNSLQSTGSLLGLSRELEGLDLAPSSRHSWPSSASDNSRLVRRRTWDGTSYHVDPSRQSSDWTGSYSNQSSGAW